MKIGTIVKYWKGVKSGEPSGTGKVVCVGDICGEDVVWIKGCRGCVSMTHIEVLTPNNN